MVFRQKPECRKKKVWDEMTLRLGHNVNATEKIFCDKNRLFMLTIVTF